jgi:tRNA pseudouridine38-40 synthase
VASFLTCSRHPPEVFLTGLNHYLPRDIAVWAVAEVPGAFDVRRQARSRRYRYLVYNGDQRSPLWRRFAWHVQEPPSLEAMARAARSLLGEHDFAAFTQPALAERRNTRRRITRAEVKRRGHLVSFDVEANAFLPHQVRRTMAALVRVGSERITVEEFGNLVGSAPPGAAALTAPPHGLYLLKVRFDRELFGKENEDHKDV